MSTIVDEAPPSALDILLGELRRVTGELHHTRELLHSVWLAPHSLAVELVLLDSAGIATRDYEVPFSSVMVMNPTNTTITVFPGPASGSTAPPSGPGVTPLAPGVAMTIPLVGRTLSIWGPASALVWIAPSPVPLPPMFGSAGSQGGITPVPFAAGALRASSGVYRGFSLKETAGAAASVRLFDNASAASGTILEEIDLAPNETAREWYGDGGIEAVNGVFAQVVAGAVEGSVRIG